MKWVLCNVEFETRDTADTISCTPCRSAEVGERIYLCENGIFPFRVVKGWLYASSFYRPTVQLRFEGRKNKIRGAIALYSREKLWKVALLITTTQPVIADYGTFLDYVMPWRKK